MAYFQTISPPMRDVSRREDAEEIPVLILAPFNKAPTVIFKDVSMGSTVTKSVLIKNPTKNVFQVCLIKLPSPDRNLVFSETNFIVQPEDQKCLDIAWKATEPGSWHSVLSIHTNHTLKLDIIIICSCLKKYEARKRSALPSRSKIKMKYSSTVYKQNKIRLQLPKNVVESGLKKFYSEGKKSGSSINFESPLVALSPKLPATSTSNIKSRRDTFLVSPEVNEPDKKDVTRKCKPVVSATAVYFPDYRSKNMCSLKRSRMRSVCEVSSGRESMETTFNQRLQSDSFCFTPDHGNSRTDFNLSPVPHFTSPNGDELPPCDVSPSNLRRSTFALSDVCDEINLPVDCESSKDLAITDGSFFKCSATVSDNFSDSLEEAINPHVGESDQHKLFKVNPGVQPTELVQDEAIGLHMMDEINTKMYSTSKYACEALSVSPNNTLDSFSCEELDRLSSGTYSIEKSPSELFLERQIKMEKPISPGSYKLNFTSNSETHPRTIQEECIEEMAMVESPRLFELDFSPVTKKCSVPPKSGLTSSSKSPDLSEINFSPIFTARYPRALNISTPAIENTKLSIISNDCVSESKPKVSHKAFASECLVFSPPVRCLKDITHATNLPNRLRDRLKISQASNTQSVKRKNKRPKSELPVPISKLKLAVQHPQKNEKDCIQLHDPDKVLAAITNPRLFAATSSGNPFLLSAIYYDLEWFDTREKEFVKWLNSLLTPPEQLTCNAALPKVDVGEVWKQSCSQNVAPAPSREVVSDRYHTKHRLNSLRRSAFTMFQTNDIAQVLSKVVVHIEKNILSIRKDKNVYMDVGLKRMVLELLLCYNPLWLRIGLETIYGKTIPLQSNSDVVGLTGFIIRHVLSDTYLMRNYSHPVVPNQFLKGFDVAMKKFILKKILQLIYFLDYSKENKLIAHDPCLFCKNAMYKESKDILVNFARELLSGVGDITKHLRSLGYIVKHKQTYLNEFDYAVTHLGADLRDGIRLSRVVEIILQDHSLLPKLRTPAISKLQKVHNVQVALSALLKAGHVIEGGVTAHDIVEGNKEKTMSLLWQILYEFQVPHFNATAIKIQKWWHNNSLRIQINKRICIRKQIEAKQILQTTAALTIQKHWRAYSVHKTYRCYVQAAILLQTRWRRLCLSKRVHSEYLQKRQTIIKLQALVRGFLLRRSLPFLRATRAAIQIQSWYRRYKRRKTLEIISSLYNEYRRDRQEMCRAILTIQHWFKSVTLVRKERDRYQNQKNAAVTIQNWYRGAKAMQIQQNNYTQHRNATVRIQYWYRASKTMQVQRNNFTQHKNAAVTIQKWYRATKNMQTERDSYAQHKNAAVSIQNWYRATKTMQVQRTTFTQQKNAAVTIQRWYRAFKTMQVQRTTFTQQKNAAVTIQRWYRAFKTMQVQRTTFTKQKNAAVTIQKWYRATKTMQTERDSYAQHKNAAVRIQNWYRATKTMQVQRTTFKQHKNAAVTIQKWYKATKTMQVQRTTFTQHKNAAITIQKWYRVTKTMHIQRTIFTKHKHAAIAIQKWYRVTKTMQIQRTTFTQHKNAAVTIQKWYRATKNMQTERDSYAQHRNAAVRIQNWYRATKTMQVQRNTFTQNKNAAVTIQKWYRATKTMQTVRDSYAQHRNAAARIQNWYRATKTMQVQRNTFTQNKNAAVTIQKWYRATKNMQTVRDSYAQHRNAAARIQNWYRATKTMQTERDSYAKHRNAAVRIQNWYRATKTMQTERDSYAQHRNAAVRIQNWYRATKTMQTERDSYAQHRNAAVRIQNWYRATKTMQTERDSYAQHRNAAVRIQKWYRTTKTMQVQRNSFTQNKNAAVTIQKWYRATKTMQTVRDSYAQHRNAAARIQNWYRATKTMQTERDSYAQHRNAAVRIQNWYRATKTMQTERDSYAQHRNAAARIQNWYRATKTMQTERDSYAQHRNAAVRIQNWYRTTKTMQVQRNSFTRNKNAAVTIQKWYRATKTMQTVRDSYAQHRNAAARIQNWYRATKTMQVQRNTFTQNKNAAVTIQKWLKATKTMQVQRTTFTQHKNAAVTIQKWYRATKTMQTERDSYAQHRNAAVRIQNWYRATKTMQTERDSYAQHRNAAVRIQNWYRATKTMQTERDSYAQHRNAAVRIQNWYRTTKTMQVQRNSFTRNKNAAVTIQKWYRATKTMQTVRDSYAQHRNAAARIQNWYRATKTMQTERDSYAQHRNAVVRIQNWYRATKYMQAQKNTFMQKKNAAVTIQKWYRATKTMQTVRDSYAHHRNAAARIQNWYRATKTMQTERDSYAQHRNAAVRIQNWYRTTKTMQVQRNSFTQNKNAAVTIQKWYRATKTMQTVRDSYAQHRNAAARIRNWYSATKTMQAERDSYVQHKNAAVRIQNWYRANKTMQAQRTTFTQQKNAAVIIQNWHKATKTMQVQRNAFLQNKNAAVTIQKWYRATKMERNATIICDPVQQRRFKAAIKIQAIWRGHLIRKSRRKTVVLTRDRTRDACQNTSGESLRQRYSKALRKFEAKASLGEMIHCCMVLDVVTRLSMELCAEFSTSPCLIKLFSLMNRSTRSVPDEEFCAVATRVLISLVKHEESCVHIWRVYKDMINIIIKLMSMWCGKQSSIFCNCCTVIWILSHDPEKANVIQKVPKLELQLQKFHTQEKKKDVAHNKLMARQGKCFGKSEHKSCKPIYPRTTPDWVLQNDTKPITFQNNLIAIKCTLRKLNITLDT